MIATEREVLATLNRLIACCKDGELEYVTAARDVENIDLKELFDSYAQQRAQFASELQQEVRRRGAAPKEHGTVGGALVRGWTNLKAAATGGDESVVLAECDRIEVAALKEYERALWMGLPTQVNEVLEAQYGEIQRAHDRMHALAAGSA